MLKAERSWASSKQTKHCVCVISFERTVHSPYLRSAPSLPRPFIPECLLGSWNLYRTKCSCIGMCFSFFFLYFVSGYVC